VLWCLSGCQKSIKSAGSCAQKSNFFKIFYPFLHKHLQILTIRKTRVFQPNAQAEAIVEVPSGANSVLGLLKGVKMGVSHQMRNSLGTKIKFFENSFKHNSLKAEGLCELRKKYHFFVIFYLNKCIA
jgi:hypothetical protein